MKVKKFPLRVLQMAALVMLPVFAHADQSVAEVYNSTSQTLRFPAEHNLSMREALAFAHGAEPKSADTFPIIFPLKLRNKAQFDELINALTSDSGYGKPRHLSVEEFRSIYAPSDDQVRRVVDYLNRHGFTRIEVAPNRLFVSARGNSSSIQSAFQTGMHVFAMDDGRSVYANTSAALLPPSISSIVDGVIGLDNVTLLHTNGRRSPNPINDSVPSPAELRRSAETAGAIPSVTGHWPSDFVGIYHAGNLPSGADTTVGVICAGDNIQQVVSDLSAYTNLSDLPPVNTKIIQTDSFRSDYNGNNDLDEYAMDSQTIVGVSGGVSNLLLYDAPSLTPQDLSVALNRAVSDNTAKIISMSIGGNELTFGVAAKQLMDEIFQEGIAQGQTFVISSGDNGVYSRANANKLFHQDQGEQPILDTNVEAAQLANYSVQYPASSPYVISVGATTLYTRFNSQYVEEVPMNWWYNYTYLGRNTAPRLQRNESSQIWDTVWASGGGISHFENAPAWQQHVNGGSRMRTVPDVSLDGDPQSGVFVIEQGKRIQYGGTSLSAPILAGFLARLQTQNKNRLGFPARGLYTAFSGLDRFALLNEVKLAGANGTGNGVTWNGVNYGYPLTTGFNSVSGLGSINVGNLANYINANPALFK